MNTKNTHAITIAILLGMSVVVVTSIMFPGILLGFVVLSVIITMYAAVHELVKSWLTSKASTSFNEIITKV